MLINGIDHRQFGIVTYSKDIETAQIITYDDWLRNGPTPVKIGQKEYYKLITVKFFIRGTSVQATTEKISNLATALKRCTLKFDKLDFYYDSTLDTTNTEKHNGLEQTITATFKSSYAYKDYVTVTGNGVSSLTVNNTGNLPSMAVVTITPTAAIASLTLTGFKDSVTIANLSSGVPVIIDGESCTITQNGLNKYSDATLWSFPTLLIGSNVITISNTNCNISIKYKPKWL